jgi:hypothetical protein
MGYATLAQFEVLGLRRNVITPRSRVISIVDPTIDTLGVLSPHGWGGDEALQLTATPIVGVPTPVLPTGLSASLVYRPLPVTDSDTLFQLALTVGGSAVDFSDVGAGELNVSEQRGPMIQIYLDLYSAIVDEALVNYKNDIPAPIPPILTWVVCKLAAYDIAVVQTLVTDYYFKSAGESITKSAEIARKQLEEWKDGKLLQTLVADATPDVLENGTVVFEDPNGSTPLWFGHDGLGVEAIG